MLHVTAAGDTNGDGYADFLVSDPVAGTNGFADLFYGGSKYVRFTGGSMQTPPSFTPDVKLGPSSDGAAGIGDFNGDGYSDVANTSAISGSVGNNDKVLVTFGGPAISGLPDLTIQPPSGANSFGEHLSELGDFNGDGADDLVVAAPDTYYNGTAGYVPGEIFLYYGGTNRTSGSTITTPDGHLWGIQHYSSADYAGVSVSSPGDVNGDGYNDLLFGAPYGITTNAGHSGWVALYLGTPGSIGSPVDTIWGKSGATVYLGYGMSGIDGR